MLSNTTITRKHERSVLPVDIPPVPCQACPRTQTTFSQKWQIRTAHQSNEKFICGDYTTEFVNDYIFEYATEVNEETANENDDVPEGKTVSVKCEGKQTAAIISDEVERRSWIPRDLTHFAHKVMIEKKTLRKTTLKQKSRSKCL